MSDGEDGNVVNSHLSQNGQDGEVGSQSGSKDQNEKTPDEGFQTTRTTLQVRWI